MGWVSDTFGGIKDAVSDAWDSTKDAVKDVTGISSMNDLLVPGFGVASGMGLLQGQGFMGQQLANTLAPLTGVPGQMPGGQMATGPLMGTAPASMTMGSGGTPPPETTGRDIAGLFGESGYSYGGPTQTSTALLQANPEAYQFNPLFGQG